MKTKETSDSNSEREPCPSSDEGEQKKTDRQQVELCRGATERWCKEHPGAEQLA